MKSLQLWIGVALLVVVGCDASPSASNPSGTVTEQPEASADAESLSDHPIAIRLITTEELVQELQSRLGNVVLLDMWATW